MRIFSSLRSQPVSLDFNSGDVTHHADWSGKLVVQLVDVLVERSDVEQSVEDVMELDVSDRSEAR